MKITAIETYWTRIPFRVNLIGEPPSHTARHPSQRGLWMPLIAFAGHQVRIDHLYSLARVSSPAQTDGEGLDRQMLLTREYSVETGIPIDLELRVTGSGSKGYHIRRGKKLGPLGLFLVEASERRLKPYPALAVESISRLVRLLTLDGLEVVIQIVKADCALLTLSSRRIYTKDLLNDDPGLIHTLVAEINSAGAEAKAKSDYSRYGNRKRRGRSLGIHPGWLRFDRVTKDYAIIDWCVPILVRIFIEAEDYSADRIAAGLNADRAPVFPSFNHPNRKPIWYDSYITKIVRSHAVRGRLAIGKYEWKTYRETIDGKLVEWKQFERKLTGEYEDKYPVIEEVTEQMWQRANAAFDARKNGRGPKGVDFANLFQGLAKCTCGGSMKLVSTAKARNGRERKRYHYYRCHNTARRACKDGNDRVYDYALVEREFLDVFQDIVAAYLLYAEPQDDPTFPIREQIAQRENEIRALKERQKRDEEAFDELRGEGTTEDEIAQLRHQRDINRKLAALTAEITELGQKRDQIKAMLPPKDVAQNVCGMVADLANVPADELRRFRSKINAQLKRFIARIDFDSQGQMLILFGHDGIPHQEEAKFAFRPVLNGLELRHRGEMLAEYWIRFKDDGTVEREHPLNALTTLKNAQTIGGLPTDEVDMVSRTGRRSNWRKTETNGPSLPTGVKPGDLISYDNPASLAGQKVWLVHVDRDEIEKLMEEVHFTRKKK